MEYFCVRIDVDRFVLLATTGKNAKNKPLYYCRPAKQISLVNPLI
jgi:hypothetical protein